MSLFKKTHSFERRLEEYNRIRIKYPDRLPIVVQLSDNCKDFQLDNKKYLCPMDISISHMIYIIRRRIVLREDQGIFLFINNSLVPSSALISDVYNNNVDKDGFLYITVSAESVMG
jgi:GABA(A) receptor-associated protein